MSGLEGDVSGRDDYVGREGVALEFRRSGVRSWRPAWWGLSWWLVGLQEKSELTRDAAAFQGCYCLGTKNMYYTCLCIILGALPISASLEFTDVNISVTIPYTPPALSLLT